eukprot:CAMPEP_0183789624 /NCGR_PEP_ID=MMETSP0803_2-20130417/537_1 /TAXON_ID=195967 /ORGANISM="Crustomastix stigmata, Strain CCMP3273" /LENGTH=374 /DNA_ID=CAMNT_0026033799 /DNA_START=176 /DNA_END=1297 /DNA_ORIENTATION=-
MSCEKNVGVKDINTWRARFREYLRVSEALECNAEIEKRRQIFRQLWLLRLEMEGSGYDPCGFPVSVSYPFHETVVTTEADVEKQCDAPNYIRVDGVHIYCRAFGKQSDVPDVVFIHGRSSNHILWYNQINFFAAKTRCILYDQRSYGFSQKGCSRYTTIKNDIQDLAAVLLHFGSQKCVIVAQSYGSIACTAFANLFPDKVAGIVLLSCAPGAFNIPEIFEEFMFAYEAKGRARIMNESPHTQPDTSTFFKELPPNVLQPWYYEEKPEHGYLFQMLRELNTELRALHVPNQVSTADEVIAFGHSINAWCPDKSRLSSWDIPTYIIMGNNDNLLHTIKSLAEYIHNVELNIIDNCGHFCFFEKPNEVNQVLNAIW